MMLLMKTLINHPILNSIKNIFRKADNNQKLFSAVSIMWIAAFFLYFGVISDSSFITNASLSILTLICLFAVFFIK